MDMIWYWRTILTSENLDQATVGDIILRIFGQKPNRVIARSS